MEENDLTEFINKVPTPEMLKVLEAIEALLPKLLCLYTDDPKMAEIDSFLIAGRDKDGDVRVGCWELTSDMLEALLEDMTSSERTMINEPRRSQ